MVRRGNYNILQKKIDELANRLEEEQALVEMLIIVDVDDP